MADSYYTACLRPMQDLINPTSSDITDLCRTRIADASLAMALSPRDKDNDNDDDNDDNNDNGNNDNNDDDNNNDNDNNNDDDSDGNNDNDKEGLAVAGIVVASRRLTARRARSTAANISPLLAPAVTASPTD